MPPMSYRNPVSVGPVWLIDTLWVVSIDSSAAPVEVDGARARRRMGAMARRATRKGK